MIINRAPSAVACDALLDMPSGQLFKKVSCIVVRTLYNSSVPFKLCTASRTVHVLAWGGRNRLVLECQACREVYGSEAC